jgi:hypothetical protein
MSQGQPARRFDLAWLPPIRIEVPPGSLDKKEQSIGTSMNQDRPTGD